MIELRVRRTVEGCQSFSLIFSEEARERETKRQKAGDRADLPQVVPPD